jgi:hypothetical protein
MLGYTWIGDQLQSIVLVAGNWKRREVRPASGWRGKVFWRGSVVQTSLGVQLGSPIWDKPGIDIFIPGSNVKRFENNSLQKKRAAPMDLHT